MRSNAYRNFYSDRSWINIRYHCWSNPGVHPNTVNTVVISISPLLLNYTSPLIVSIFIITVAISNSVIDSIPSIFLGAPDSEQILSVLPGHQYLLEGKGYEAVKLTVIGSLLSLIIAISLTPLLIPLVKFSYPVIKNYIGLILILLSIFLILKEKKSKFWAIITFLLAGTLGLSTLYLPNLKEPLFPLLSGMFGISGLLLSIKTKTNIPKQIITDEKVPKNILLKSLAGCTLTGTFISFLPGVSSSHGTVLSSQLTGNLGKQGFLILVGGMNTLNMVLSFVALFVINKARNGTVVTISKLLESFNINYLILFLSIALITAASSTITTLILAKSASKLITKINYQLLCVIVIISIIILITILSGYMGLLVLIISTSIGLIPQLKGISRYHMMGSLILPTILFFI